MAYDLLLTNGRIYTMDAENPFAFEVGIKGNKIIAVNQRSESPNSGKVIDLQGKILLPGFIDAHVHLFNTGTNYLLGVDCTVLSKMSELLECINRKSYELKKNEWVLGYGFDQTKIEEGRYPFAKELSEAAPSNPVAVRRRDGHSTALNWKALELLGISAGEDGVDLDEKGKPTGVVRGLANTRITGIINDLLVNETICERAYEMSANKALEVGLTTVHALVGGKQSEMSVTWLYENEGKLPVNVVIYDETTDVDKVITRGLKQIGGCLLIDGSIGSFTAGLYEPYSDNPKTSGKGYWADEDLEAFVLEAHQKGLQISMHAIGDKAIDQLLAAYEKAIKILPRVDHRHRIEHFSLPTKKAIERAGQLGLVLSMQPAFEYFWGGTNNMYGSRLGPERVKRTKPLKSITEAGIKIAGGSDSFVTPMYPLLGIHSAVNHPNEEERLTVSEAIQLFTVNGAYAAFEEKEKGMIKPHYLADLVVLSQDPFRVESASIKDIEVFMTIVGGKVQYAAE